MIEGAMLKAETLRPHMDFFNDRQKADQLKLEKQLRRIDESIQNAKDQKKRTVDAYASGDISQEAYVEKNIECDRTINKLDTERQQLLTKIPLLHKADVVDLNIRRYCEAIRARYELCTDFESKRQFVLDYIERIIFLRDAVTVCGSVPIRLRAYEDPEQSSTVSKLEFKIEGRIDRKRTSIKTIPDPMVQEHKFTGAYSIKKTQVAS